MCDFYIKFNSIFIMINNTLLIIIHQFIPPFITRLETTGLHGVVYEYESSLLVWGNSRHEGLLRLTLSLFH